VGGWGGRGGGGGGGGGGEGGGEGGRVEGELSYTHSGWPITAALHDFPVSDDTWIKKLVVNLVYLNLNGVRKEHYLS